MNLAALMQLKQEWDSFKSRHPKFPSFIRAVCGRALSEGTVVEFKVTAPDGTVINSNLKLKQEDLELIRRLRDMAS